MDDELKVLHTTHELESEEHEEEDIIRRASNSYDFVQLINSIGTSEFQAVFSNIVQNDYSNTERRDLSVEMLEKVKEEYGIELTLSNTPTMEEIVDVLKFVKFLEFEYINFIADIWKFMNVNLRSNIRLFCMANSDRIIKILDEQIETHFLPKMVSEFLRTYNKSDMINLFIRLTEKSKMLIVLRIEEEKLKNG